MAALQSGCESLSPFADIVQQLLFCIINSLFSVIRQSSQDSWAWVQYVLVDIYLFIILLHASIMWMPRPMAGQEYIKYAPLEVSVVTNNDLELWVSFQNTDILL